MIRLGRWGAYVNGAQEARLTGLERRLRLGVCIWSAPGASPMEDMSSGARPQRRSRRRPAGLCSAASRNTALGSWSNIKLTPLLQLQQKAKSSNCKKH